jgi:peptidoglycan hydrolase-like protein with peptidoglycan-binding domain
MSNTDTETQAPTPVQQSNASAALPGIGPSTSSPAGGAMAASGMQPAAQPVTSSPFEVQTTPTSVSAPFMNVQGKRYNPAELAATKPISDDDTDTAPIDEGDPAKAYLVSVANPGGSMTRQGVNVAIGRLHPAFAVGLANTIRQARAEGIPAGPFSSYRDPVRDPGGYADKWNSLHGYGLAVDVAGIGGVGSKTAQRFHKIASENGIFNPYGPDNRAEWNHFQGVPSMGRQFREAHPEAEQALRAFRLAGSPGATPPEPNTRPDTTSPAFGARGARDLPNDAPEPTGVPGAYQPSPELVALWEASGVPLVGRTFAGASDAAVLSGEIIPPQRPNTSSPAWGARGARSMPEPISTLAMGQSILDQRRSLEFGSRGDAVVELQTFLAGEGLYAGAVDGVFGHVTRRAVKAYQDRSEITVDGIAGAETYQAILYDLDPTVAVMPGHAAYEAGQTAARKILEPATADIPLPRMRPATEEAERREAQIPLPRPRGGVPDPRPNPRRQQPAEWSDVDRMTEVDAEGNYVNRPDPPPQRGFRLRQDAFGQPSYGPADIGRVTSDFRQKLLAEGWADDERLASAVGFFETRARQSGRFRYANGLSAADIGRVASDFRERMIKQGGTPPEIIDQATRDLERSMKGMVAPYQRVSDASNAARRATNQRLGTPTGSTVADGLDPSLVRSAEGMREFARGVIAAYVRKIESSGPSYQYVPPSVRKAARDELLAMVPTTSSLIAFTYGFRPRA